MLPILMVVVLGIVNLGFVFAQQISLTNKRVRQRRPLRGCRRAHVHADH